MSYLNSEPNKPEPQTLKKARLEARITQEQKQLLQEAARITGVSLTNFVIHTLVEAAKRTIEQQETMELSKRDRLFFIETLLNPPSPSTKLIDSAQKYKQRMINSDNIGEKENQ